MMKRKDGECLQALILPWQLAGLSKETPVLLGLSGGADSRALLHLLAKASERDGFPLAAAHVNHGIRGEEALRDRDFCISLAEKYGVPIEILDTDVPTLARESGRTLEEEARAVRYDFFADVMRKRKIPLLATAHHADDQLETVLFHLCRGSGLRGLCGISPVRSFGEGYLTRPLLNCSRKEILSFCEENGLEYVSDSTNTDVSYARNRIRAQVIPVLESMFHDPQSRVCEMTASLREDEAFLETPAEAFLQRYETSAGLPLCELSHLPRPVLVRVLQHFVTKRVGGAVERVHLSAMEEMLKSAAGETSLQVALPKDHIAVRELGFLRILPAATADFLPYSIPFGEGEWSLWQNVMSLSVKNQKSLTKIHNLYTETCINSYTFFDIIKKCAYWRPRQEGDTLLRGGMHKKIRKLWGQAQIPPRLRGVLPLLCDGEGVLFAPFVGWRDGICSAADSGDRDDGYTLRIEIH